MTTGHPHGRGHASARAGARHAGRLAWALGVVAAFFVVEAVAAIVTGSLALLSDAGHMLTDVAGLGMALAAIHIADRFRTSHHHSFGLYRLEILAALFNAVLLFGVAGYVLVEAAARWGSEPEIPAGSVLVVAAAGLAANVVAFVLVRPGAQESLNVRGAYLEVLADLVGSLVVVVSAGVIALTGWHWIDVVAGAGLGLWILPRAAHLARHALRILLQSAPPEMDLEDLARELAALPTVVDVHDLHVWTLTSDMEVASAHLMIVPGSDTHAVLDQARALLAERYGVVHATLQVEPTDHSGCSEVTW